MNQKVINYYDEIAKMLFGFGDYYKPNEDTVELVETIVLQQLRTIITEALKVKQSFTEYISEVDSRSLRGEELVFLLRHNKKKMHRFIRHLQTKESNKEIDKDGSIIEIKHKQKHPLIEFIEYIDETGELTDLGDFDEIKHERALRANEVSIALDKKMYDEYHKARCTSFLPQVSNYQKFQVWLDPSGEIQFTSVALQVLAYYGHETVAELADFAFQVRLDSKKGPDLLDTMKVHCVQRPITVKEINEVMRRVYSPQAGKLKFGRKLPETHYLLAL